MSRIAGRRLDTNRSENEQQRDAAIYHTYLQIMTGGPHLVFVPLECSLRGSMVMDEQPSSGFKDVAHIAFWAFYLELLLRLVPNGTSVPW